MKDWKKKRLQLWRDEEGQTTTEYILILAVVVVIALKVKDNLGTVLGDSVDSLGTKVQSIVTDIE